jgi:hypothetical protein
VGDGIIAAFGEKIGIYEDEAAMQKALEKEGAAKSQAAALTPAELDAERALRS